MGKKERKKKGLEKVPLLRFCILDGASSFLFYFPFLSFADKEEGIVTKIIYSETFCLWKQVKEQGLRTLCEK